MMRGSEGVASKHYQIGTSPCSHVPWRPDGIVRSLQKSPDTHRDNNVLRCDRKTIDADDIEAALGRRAEHLRFGPGGDRCLSSAAPGQLTASSVKLASPQSSGPGEASSLPGTCQHGCMTPKLRQCTQEDAALCKSLTMCQRGRLDMKGQLRRRQPCVGAPVHE